MEEEGEEAEEVVEAAEVEEEDSLVDEEEGVEVDGLAVVAAEVDGSAVEGRPEEEVVVVEEEAEAGIRTSKAGNTVQVSRLLFYPSRWYSFPYVKFPSYTHTVLFNGVSKCQ